MEKKHLLLSFVFSFYFPSIILGMGEFIMHRASPTFCPPQKNSFEGISFGNLITLNPSFELFEEVASKFISLNRTRLSNNLMWFNGDCPFLNPDLTPEYWEKITAAQINYAILYEKKLFIKPHTKTLAFTDLHADDESLNKILIDMYGKKYIDKNCKLNETCLLLGLGDYVDRGDNNFKILAKLMLLFIKNPDKVALLRGNHESLQMNFSYQGLPREMNRKFFPSNSLLDFCGRTRAYELLAQIYELMPSNLYLETINKHYKQNKILLCSHALFDFSHNPIPFLDMDNAELKSEGGERFCSIFENYSGNQVAPNSPKLGPIWHDIAHKEPLRYENPSSVRQKHNPLEITDFWTTHTTESHKVVGIVGGHQHCIPKFIQGIDLEFLSSAASFIRVNALGGIEDGIIDSNTIYHFFIDSFSVIKFVSSPIPIGPNQFLGYKPTYLEIYKNKEQNWIFQITEC